MLPVLLPATAAALYSWAVFISTFDHPGSIGINYIAPGTDWMVLYGAVKLAILHHFSLLLDGPAFTQYLNTSFAHWLSQPLFYRPWVYPPSFLVLLLPFSSLGLMASFAAFQLTTAALLGAALMYRRGDTKPGAPWIVLAVLVCPAASENACSGQCAFLVAALLIFGVRLLDGRPWIAGAVLGLLSIKPQFGLMVPVLLLAARQWRGAVGALASGAGLAALSALIFGPELWRAWIVWSVHAATESGSAWSTNGRLWGSSVYACAVLLHIPGGVASLLQIAASAFAAACVYLAYRSHGATDRTLTVLLAATLLAAPHWAGYDDIALTAAGLLWFACLPVPRLTDRLVLLLLWLAPLYGPPVLVPVGRATPLLIAVFMAMSLWVSRHQDRQAKLAPQLV